MRRAAAFRWPLALALILCATSALPLSGTQTEPHSWKVVDLPTFSVGSAMGAEEDVLVNPVGLTRLSDGTIVIADFTSGFFQLRYHDRAGESVASAGRFGEGPFEFRAPPAFIQRLPGDSVLVGSQGYRYSVFGPRGERIRGGRWEIAAGKIPFAVVNDGNALLVVGESFPGRTPARGTVSRSAFELSLFSFDGADQRIAPVLPGGTTAITDDGRYVPPHFEARALWTPVGDTFWYVDPRAPRDIVATPISSTTAVSRIQVMGVRRRVDGAAEDRWREWVLGGAPPPARRGVEAMLGRLDVPDSLPVVQALLPDDEGNLWALEYGEPWSEADYFFAVYDEDGNRIARARLPYHLVGRDVRHPLRSGSSPWGSPIMWIGSDEVLIRDMDELGVVRVRGFRIEKRR